MSVSEADLLTILSHCRDLLAAANELEAIRGDRHERIGVATRQWRGPHARTFGQRIGDEGLDIDSRITGLKNDADEWASIWARTVNEINTARRDAAVDAERNSRSFGESFVDVFVGDDSNDMVRSYTPVDVPTAATNYAATGGLEYFG